MGDYNLGSPIISALELPKSQFFTLHTTLSDSEFEKAKKVVASEIESEFDKQTIFQNNHPGLNSTQFFEVLEGAKIFIGLGFPFEGPSPIEALQAGCYFINPIWEPPIGRSLNGENSKEYIRGFFSNKPTVRQLESQVPYLATINRNSVENGPLKFMQYQSKHCITSVNPCKVPINYNDKN